MNDQIVLKNNDVLIKFINSLERVLFLDNKSMKDYNDIKNNIKRDYEGVSLYLRKILDSLEDGQALAIVNNLPDKEDLIQCSEEVRGVVLESFTSSFYLNEDREDNQYIVIACPELERVFHLKSSQKNDFISLQKIIVKDFFHHHLLPRIKIYTRNLEFLNDVSSLRDLKFLYTLIEDANIQTNSYKSINNQVSWSELVADPAYGVQVGNMGAYFIAPLKIIGLKRDIENLHQLRLIVEENSKKFEVCIKTSYYAQLFKGDFEEGELEKPFYLRSLIFQAVGEDFRHLIKADLLNEEQFIEDSVFSYVRFRKVTNKENIKNLSSGIIPKGLIEKSNSLFYLPDGFSPDMFDVAKSFSQSNKLNISFSLLKKYHEFQKLYQFHPEWKEIYENNKNSEDFYKKLKIIYQNPFGVHRSFIYEPSKKMAFYAKKKKINLLCTHCFKYKSFIAAESIPEVCPECTSKAFVNLSNEEDEVLLKENLNINSDNPKIKYYAQLSTLSITFNKFLFYILNCTPYSLNTCIKILNELRSCFVNEDLFFDKLYKISQTYDKKEDIRSVIYKLEKDEL